MVALDHPASPPLKRELGSPKSLRLLPGFTSPQGLLSLLALAFGLLLLLQHSGFESAAWRPRVVSFAIPGLGITAPPAVSLNRSNLNHSLSAAAPEDQHNDPENNVVACELAKGRWVEDLHRPLYTGKFCRRVLAQPWHCRRNKHRNLSYELFRWQPDDCDLAPFDADKFLRRMTNKTIGFIGDSLGRQQFQSLICMLTGGGRIRAADISQAFRLSRGSAAYAFPSSNTTILYYWSTTLAEEEHREDGSINLHIDRVPVFLRHHIHLLNLVVINSGHHWNRGKMKINRWLPHLGGEPLTRGMSMGEFRQTTLDNCAKWLSAESEKRDGDLQVLVRSLSPRHFRGGEWDSGGRCDNIVSMAAEEEQPFKVDEAVEMAARGRVNVRVLEVGYMSRMRGEAHIGMIGVERQDCLHWCLPGVPDAWNELMFGLLVGSN